MNEIVVGVDGSESSTSALRWAWREAQVRDWKPRAVLVAGSLDAHGEIVGERVDPQFAQREIGGDLDRIVDDALGDGAGAVAREVTVGLVVPALLRAAESAALLALGSRGLGGFRGLLLGSVTRACLQRATCPVVVVREARAHTDEVRRVVVGVDGSADAKTALAWAADAAALHDASVEIVSAWSFPSTVYERFAAVPIDTRPFEEVAHHAIENAVAATPGLGDVTRTVRFGSPAAAILDAAHDADVVVVGSRGLGTFTGWVLGSVSQQVVEHAPCPVVVLPPGEPRGDS